MFFWRYGLFRRKGGQNIGDSDEGEIGGVNTEITTNLAQPEALILID
jgi:hypothetical protein